MNEEFKKEFAKLLHLVNSANRTIYEYYIKHKIEEPTSPAKKIIHIWENGM